MSSALSGQLRPFRGHTPSVGQNCMIDSSSVLIGDVSLGDDVAVFPMVVIRGDMQSIRIGNGTNIQDGSILHITHDGPYTKGGYPLTVGNYVIVGHRVTLHGCTIGDHVLVGMGATVMDGAKVDSEVIIGSHALVTPNQKLGSGYLYVGMPAKKVRALTDEEKDMLRYNANNYIKLKDEYLAAEHV